VSRLAAILDFEYLSISEKSKRNPVGIALPRIIKKTPQASTVVFISALNHDAEAIMLYKARIDKMGYSSFIMNGENGACHTLGKVIGKKESTQLNRQVTLQAGGF